MRNTLTLAALISMSACAAPGAVAQWEAEANQPIICTVGEQCDLYWSRAVSWISTNSNFRFQQQTDLLISTYCGRSGDPSPCYEVSKRLEPGGKARIFLSVRCQNVFGCTPHRALTQSLLAKAILGH